jgi:hypothetical protein
MVTESRGVVVVVVVCAAAVGLVEGVDDGGGAAMATGYVVVAARYECGCVVRGVLFHLGLKKVLVRGLRGMSTLGLFKFIWNYCTTLRNITTFFNVGDKLFEGRRS